MGRRSSMNFASRPYPYVPPMETDRQTDRQKNARPKPRTTWSRWIFDTLACDAAQCPSAPAPRPAPAGLHLVFSPAPRPARPSMPRNSPARPPPARSLTLRPALRNAVHRVPPRWGAEPWVVVDNLPRSSTLRPSLRRIVGTRVPPKRGAAPWTGRLSWT
eukprot:scaffold29950_cov60-Phaeocystis_antarctica.AAC.3